jgi:hypothetical protein
MNKHDHDKSPASLNSNSDFRKDYHEDEKNVDFDFNEKDYPIMEHMSNARLMPMTGPYGRLDMVGTYEYGTVPENPSTPLEPYEVVMDKNTKK